jgi:uncharacterized membrane protein
VVFLVKVHPLDKVSSAFSDYPFPADLKVILILLVADMLLISSPFLNASPYKILCSIPLLFFIPGYCCISVLYPRDGDLSLPQRIVLSFGFSVPVVLVTALGVYLSLWIFQLDSLIMVLSLISVALILVAHYRRARVRPQDLYRPQFSEIPAALRQVLAPLGGDRVDRLLSAALILVMIIAVSTTILVIVLPKENEHFTDFFILGANRMAQDYPYEITGGQNYPMYIGVGNHEKRNTSYTIETWSVKTTFDPVTNTTKINSMDPGDRFSFFLADNETTTLPYSLSIKNIDVNRVVFLLFNETAPGPQVSGSDRINASYRDLYLRVSVGQAFYPEGEGNVT